MIVLTSLFQKPKFKIRAKPVHVASSYLVMIEECIKIDLSCSSHMFQYVAYFPDIIEDIDFVKELKV